MANIRIKRTAKKLIVKTPPSTSSKATRLRRPGSPKPSAFSEAKKRSPLGYAGAKGFQQADREKEKSEEQRRKRSVPWNVWMAPGTEADFIITDVEPYFMYEHQYKGGDGKPAFERCIKDQGNCPLCSKLNREGYYVMKLAGIDLRGYKKKDGTTVKASRKILNVKQAQMKKFQRMYEKNGNSFRGVKIHMTRDGDKDSVIGNDIEVTATLSDQKLARYGDDMIKPFNMEEAFPRLSEKAMAKQYGAAASMGASDFNKDEDDADADDESW